MSSYKSTMIKYLYEILMTLLTINFTLLCSGQQPLYDSSDSTISAIQRELLSVKIQDPHSLDGESIFSFDLVQQFYQHRQYMPAWIDHNRITVNAKRLIFKIESADLEGLNPLDYHLQTIRTIRLRIKKPKQYPQESARLDILFTDAYLTYAKHLYLGKICPDDVNQQWYVPCRELEVEFWDYLTEALEERNISESLELLKPNHPGYAKLKKALARYRKLYHDSTQKRSVLDADTSLTRNLLTIAANLERWRWLPNDLGSRYILVNIADFSLNVMEEDKVVFSRPVVIGTPYRATPALAAELSLIVLNPYWYLPESVVMEILLKQDPASYLERNNIQILDHRDQVVPYHNINWSDLETNDFNYLLRQTPGPHNALGKIKFIMPNPHAIYIHDTPDKSLFSETNRTFSRGCIRVKDPFELADLLLRDEPEWNQLDLETIANNSTGPFEIELSKSIPVYVLYWTSWIDSNETLQFRPDIYQRDKALIEALDFPLETK